MKHFAKIAGTALLLAGMASMAQAQQHGHRGRRSSNFNLQIGSFGISIGTPRYSNFRPSYQQRDFSRGVAGYRSNRHVPQRRQTWLDTSRYGYHDPTIVRQRVRYNEIPGHHDLRRSRYWDGRR